jgi:hypothetical protein
MNSSGNKEEPRTEDQENVVDLELIPEAVPGEREAAKQSGTHPAMRAALKLGEEATEEVIEEPPQTGPEGNKNPPAMPTNN